jgi:Glycosyltransferase family 87
MQRLTWLFVSLMVIGSIVGVITPAGLGWDFGNFYDTGRRAAAGQIADVYDPSTPIAGEAPQGKMRFWGPPVSAYFFVPMSWFSPETALILFKIQNVLVFAAAFVVLFMFYANFVANDDRSWWHFAATFAFLCLIYQPFWTVFRVGGQTTPTVLLLLSLGLVLHTRAWFWGSALCVTLAILFKPAMAPIMLFLMVVSGVPFFVRATILMATVALASLALLGWPIHAAFLSRVLGDSQATFEWYSNSSLYILIDNLRIGVGPAASRTYNLLFVALQAAMKLMALATVVYLTIASRRHIVSPAGRRHFDFLTAIAFFLLWSATLWEHYLAVLFPLLAYVVAAREYFSRRALVLVALIFVLSIGQNLIFTMYLRDHFLFESLWSSVGIALYKSGPLLLTAIFLWRHHGELYGSYSSPAWDRPSVSGQLFAGAMK